MLLVRDPSTPIVDVMREETVTLGPLDDAKSAVAVFERYDLVSAPVVDDRGKLVGRLTVEAVMDVLRDESSLQALRSAGLSQDEDLFASLWDSARNRWPWLAINLVTAFIASRVIGQFEGVIQQLAALAALMPIVASIGGNTGNQTMALVIRSLATDQIQPDRARRLLSKELSIGVLNGSVWGLLVGVFAIVIYSQVGARAGDDGRGRPEPGGGGGGRGADSAGAARDRPRPGPWRQRAADVHHRRHGLLPVSRPRPRLPRLAEDAPAA